MVLRAIARSGASDYNDLTNLPGDALIFAPANKYSPLVFTKDDGYANGQPDISRTIPTHDASAGAVPSYTTAKKRSIAVVTVAGTLGGVSVAKGDYLMALQDDPTTAEHWAIIGDSTAEFEAAVEAAQGGPVEMNGTFMLVNSNPDARLYIRGDAYIFTRLDKAGIYQSSNITYATNATLNYQASAVTKANYTEPNTGTSLQRGTRFTLSTIGNAANLHIGQMMVAFCDTATPDTAGESSKCYIREAFRIQAIDTASGYIYANKVLRWHTEIAAATNKYIGSINDDRAVRVDGNITFGGGPTIIGESVGWWQTMRGDQVTATLSSSTTITRTAHGLVVGQRIQAGLVSGTLTTTCAVATVPNADSFTITIPSTQDYSGSAPGFGTSGTIYYAPSFVVTDTTHVGGALVLQNAPESRVRVSHDRLWSAGTRIRFSDFSEVEIIDASNLNDPHTDNNNTLGRLVYAIDDYASTDAVKKVHRSVGPRHTHTDNGRSTSSSWSSTMWISTSGHCVNSRTILMEGSADGGGADTHEGSNGAKIHADCHFPCRMPFEGSYQGFYGNVRGSNEIRTGSQIGGYEGIVFRAKENQAGSIHYIDLKFSKIPYVNSNQVALRTESLTSITNKPIVTGRLEITDCGRGFKIDNGWVFNLTEFYHDDIAYSGGYILSNGVFRAETATLDYTKNSSGEATRYGFLMDDTATMSFGRLNIRMGASANPAEIFTNLDGDSGKTINIGILDIYDPSNVGRPPVVETAEESDFTVNVGMIIYNGAIVHLNADFYENAGIVSGRYLVGPAVLSLNAFVHGTANIYACPLIVKKRQTFTGISFGVDTACTNLNVKVGLYTNSNGPAALIAGSTATGGPYTEVASATKDVAFSAALTLDPGIYWAAIQTDQNQSLFGTGSAAGMQSIGAGNMHQTGSRISVANTYADGMPSPFGTITYTAAGGLTHLGLKAQ